MVELPTDVHPWFVGCQFHPEFTSNPRTGHPLFIAYVRAALAHQHEMKCCGSNAATARRIAAAANESARVSRLRLLRAGMQMMIRLGRSSSDRR